MIYSDEVYALPDTWRIYFFLRIRDNSGMIKLLKPIAHCYGVINAINLARRIAKEHQGQNIYVFGLLVHNDEVTKDLLDLGIKTIDLTNKDPYQELAKFDKNDIVIFTAHGHPDDYEKVLNKRGVTYFDATCPKVKECFKAIKAAKETIYIGKKNHPEANAALTMNNNVHFYDINEKFDYAQVKSQTPLVINQTTLSFLELKDIHQEVKENIKSPQIIDEICDATLLRQKAITELSEDVDTIIIVGSKKSSNTMKLYQVALNSHPNKQVCLFESVMDAKKAKIKFNNAVIASGTSTPLNTINEIKEYLERK